MAKTVAQVWQLEDPGARAVDQQTAKLIIPSTNVITSEQKIGIEVEVENFQANDVRLDGCWQSKGDGSLRNNGMEFVSRVIQAKDAPALLENLMNQFLSKDCCFSPRTSVHVHFNMIPYSVDVVKNITMLYSCFEPLFFRFTGRGRMKNIYCVPLVDTTTLQHFERNQLRDTAARWVKYTSLNLLPLTNYGTIEARHMHGTFDVQKLCIWIRMWCRVIEYCLKNDVTTVRKIISGMTEATDYPSILKDIFDNDVQFMKYREWSDIKHSVTTVKTAFASANTAVSLIAERDAEKAPYFTFKGQR